MKLTLGKGPLGIEIGFVEALTASVLWAFDFRHIFKLHSLTLAMVEIRFIFTAR